MPEPLFDWLNERGAGVLLHPTSLPNTTGIGTLGPEAVQLIDFLHEAELVYWQILPLGPTGFGDSPYASFSAFAGNPYLIDVEALTGFGLLKPAELEPLRALPRDRVDFGGIYRTKWPILRLAHRRFREQKLAYLANYGLFSEFCEAEASWLDAFALFMAIKQHLGGKFWGEWPADLGSYTKARKHKLAKELEEAVEAQKFYQYVFFGQWRLLRRHAARQGVEIIGDAPIFVALDSADVWANPELFQLDKEGRPTHVAGVPPDYFSPTGQLWGNPLYDWDRMKTDGYAWWMRRLEQNFKLYDIVRLDHFRGFYNYWEIPATAGDARKGQWRDGPQLDFFQEIRRRFPDARIIAEDLGDIGTDVRDFLAQTGLPGMAILQFAFDCHPDNLYLPHSLQPNSVLYPGTHDNNTIVGWYEGALEEHRDQVRRYLRVGGEDIAWDIIRAAYRSVSRLVIIQMQDLMTLDADARMNRPGTAWGNWHWRYTPEQFAWQKGSTAYLRELAWLYNR